ncbi:MAG: DDE-type integrase/transposase/recombinase, partial [Cyanobacteria bacterium J06600_6]
YYNIKHPAGFSSIAKLAKATDTKEKIALAWLKEQPAYTLHREARKNYPTRPYIIHDIDEQWQADLADVSLIANFNQGYRYILTVIDLFSRYAWARPLKSKRGDEVAKAFKEIFIEGRIPKRIQTDQGREFYNSHVQNLFNEYNVELFSVKSAYKAAIVERFNRTLKHRLWRYFTSENKQEWKDVLQDAVYSYNHSVHRSIKRKPANVTASEVSDMREEMAKKVKPPAGKDDIHVGDTVRISKMKRVFEKGYLPNWTEEIFTVAEINRKYTPITYKLKDYNNDLIEGSFYRYEIQTVKKKDDVYLVERVIRKRRYLGEMWCLVKWQGYPSSMNSWVRDSDMSVVTQRR